MTINWASVKKQTLWSYEDLLGKLQAVLAYDFVAQHYNHTFKQAQAYARKVRRGYLQDTGNMTVYLDGIIANLQELERLRAGTYASLVQRVASREACQDFLAATGFGFDPLIQTLNYLFRWVLPFRAPVRELIDLDDAAQAGFLPTLKEHHLTTNLDLLEAGRTRAGRARLARATGLPLAWVTRLVHRADISRLAYVRGKSVKYLCEGGYDTLAKLAAADLPKMEAGLERYFETQGKSLANYRSVLPLRWMIGGAKILPRVVE